MTNSSRESSPTAQGADKRAFELAKKKFKKSPSPETKEELISIYLARFRFLSEKGEHEAAAALLESLVRRFPDTENKCRNAALGLEDDVETRFDKAIENFLAISPDDRDYRESSDLLSQNILNPDQILDSQLVPETHPLKLEAKIISDCFSRVTAGKSIDKALADLGAIGRSSPFSKWRRIILGIVSFYRRDFESMEKHLKGIPDRHPTHALVCALRAMAYQQPYSGSPASKKNFHLLQRKILGAKQELLNDISSLFLATGPRKGIAAINKARKLIPKIQAEFPESVPNFIRSFTLKIASSRNFRTYTALSALIEEIGFDPLTFKLIAVKGWRTSKFSGLAVKLLASIPFSSEGSHLLPAEKAFLLMEAVMIARGLEIDNICVPTGPRLEKTFSRRELLKIALDWHHFSSAAVVFILELLESGESKSIIMGELKHFLEEEPRNVRIMVMLSQISMELGDPDEAVRYLQMAESEDSLHPKLKALRRFLLLDRLEEFARSRRVDPGEMIDSFRKNFPVGNPSRTFLDLVVWAKISESSDAKLDPAIPGITLLHPSLLELYKRYFLRNFRGKQIGGKILVPKYELETFFTDLVLVIQAFQEMNQVLPLGDIDISNFSFFLSKNTLSVKTLLSICSNAESCENEQWLFLFSQPGLNVQNSTSYKFLFYRALSYNSSDPKATIELLEAAEKLGKNSGDPITLEKIRGILHEFRDLEFRFMRYGKEQRSTDISESRIRQILRREFYLNFRADRHGVDLRLNLDDEEVEEEEEEEYWENPHRKPKTKKKINEGEKQLKFNWENDEPL